MGFKHGNFRVIPAAETAYDPDIRMFGDLKARVVHSTSTPVEVRPERPSVDLEGGRVAVDDRTVAATEPLAAPVSLKAPADLHLMLDDPFADGGLMGYESLGHDAGGFLT